MANFQEMARKAKEAAQAAASKRAAEAAETTRLEIEQKETNRRYISEHVKPQLMQAKDSFGKEGIGCQIDEGQSFSHGSGSSVKPIYFASIRCHDLASDQNHPYQRYVGGTVRFEYDGVRLIAKGSWEGQFGGSIAGVGDQLVERGIERALERYLARSDD